MSAVKDTFFGGAEKDAGRRNKRELEKSQELIAKQTAIAREDATKLFGGAQDSARAGYQGALDVFGQTLPEQARLFQQGNVGAQQQVIGGLPQIQAALLGQPVNMQAFQPTQITPNMDWAQQTLPEVTPIADVLKPPGELSSSAKNVNPRALEIVEAFNSGNLSRDQAMNRLLKGNAPGKGNKFPGIAAAIANELLDFQGGS